MKITIAIFLFFGLTLQTYAASLDEVYRPLIKKNNWLYEVKGNYFGLYENGSHGSASFDGFSSYPHYSSLAQELNFSPYENWELLIGYGHTPPSYYRRPTENNLGAVTSLQKYRLEYFQDYKFDIRTRYSLGEIYFNFWEKRHRSNWTFASSLDAPPTYLNYFSAHLEDMTFGIKHLSLQDKKDASTVDNVSRLKQPLLNKNQIEINASLRYRNGLLERKGIFYLANRLNDSFRHRLHFHLTPQMTFRYGLKENLEILSGFEYTTPFTYSFKFKRYNTNGTTNFLDAQYRLTNNFSIPLSFNYRPQQNVKARLSLPFEYSRQHLSYSEKELDNTTTLFADKTLGYYHSVPSIKLSYLADNDKEIFWQPFIHLKETFLRKGQILYEIQLSKDVSSLKKNAEGGTQNIIDPYNVFLYPVEFFTAGSEYAAFFSGNTATSPSEVKRQNHLTVDILWTLGLTDSWNMSLGSGYLSKSAVHQFDVKDQGNRFFRFKGYYYVDLSTAYAFSQSSLFSFGIHFVPEYRTLMESSLHPEGFKAETRYFKTEIRYKKLF